MNWSLFNVLLTVHHSISYSENNVMHFLFRLLGIKGLTCFEHYLLILRRHYTNGTWYIACMLCQLAYLRHNATCSLVQVMFQLFKTIKN
jgi:hypothetical protein